MSQLSDEFAAIQAQLTGPGAPWETKLREDGTRYYIKAPANLVDALAVARQYDDQEFLVYEGERRSFT